MVPHWVATATIASTGLGYWLLSHHGPFVRSLVYTSKITAYGVHTDIYEALLQHGWYLLVAGHFVRNRQTLLHQVHEDFQRVLQGKDHCYDTINDNSKQALLPAAVSTNEPQDTTQINAKNGLMITHSCRSIFYCVIQTLLDEALEKKGQRKLRIAIASVHFGSFYRLLDSIKKEHNDTEIEFYEIDLKPDDWSLDEAAMDEDQVRTCDLIFCQQFFGVPFAQNKLVEMGRKHNIPILEDCVQSGSLYGNYKGHPQADITIWSGGLDKTPSCMGAGFGCFRPHREHGRRLYDKCNQLYESFPVDSWRDRSIICLNQLAHLMIAKNSLGIVSLLGVIFACFFPLSKGQTFEWYTAALAVRKDKSVTPFQHATTKFCKQPSAHQLLSIRHGLRKIKRYAKAARHEIWARRILLDNIPATYHSKLFPWLTPQVLAAHEANLGISEFCWMAAPDGSHRRRLCDFLNEHYLIGLINTTWEYHREEGRSTNKSVPSMGQHICESLVYLPNLNEMKRESQIVNMARVLTLWAQQEYGGADKPTVIA